jgi:SH3-like domain-containing protein
MNFTLLFLGALLLAGAAPAEALCVKVAWANLRTGPGTGYAKSWEVGKYMPLEKIGVCLTGQWYAVRDVDGDTHWIHSQLVNESCRAAVVCGEKIAVRSGPGRRHAQTRLGRVSKYHCFKILRQQGSWVQVRDAQGNQGWIHDKFLWMP